MDTFSLATDGEPTPDGLVIAEPTWFPAPDATPEDARRWLDEFSGWALSDDGESDGDAEEYC